MKSQKRGNEEKSIRNNRRFTSIIADLWFFALIFMLDLARALFNQQNLLATNDYNYKKKMVKKKIIYFILLGLSAIILISYATASPADPGHEAIEISAGIFESGNYTFPDSLHIDKFLNVTGLLYVDPLTSRVGISTINPQNALEVVGTINATAIQVGTTNVCQSDGTNCPVGAGGSESPFTNDTVEITATTSVAASNLNFTFDGGTFFIDPTTNNVGIGTTGPGAKLDVAGGDIWLDSGSWIRQDGNALIGGTNINKQAYVGTTDFKFNAQDGTPLVTILASGNVGIGTTAPTQELNVVGDLNVTEGVNLSMYTTCTALETDSSGNLLCGSDADTGATLGKDQWGWSNDTNVVWTTQLTDKVGIGTAAPTQSLNVEGTANITGDFFLSVIGLASCTGKLITSSDGNVTCGSDTTGNDLAYDPSNIAFLNESELNASYVRRIAWTDHDNYPANCSTGQYVMSVDDTLGCETPPGTGAPSDLSNYAVTNESETFDLNITASDSVIAVKAIYGPGTGITGTASGLSIGGNAATATALAANGANCAAGQYPLGVDASGAVESCTVNNDVAYDPANIAFLNESELNASYVRRIAWTDHENYPDACGAGQYVTQVGDTLTCSVPVGTVDWTNVAFLNETVLNNTYFRLVDDGTIFNATFALNVSLDQYQARNNWAEHDNYPSACSAGQAVLAIGDTLTCATVENTTEEWQDAIFASGAGDGIAYDDAGNAITFDCSEVAGDYCSTEDLAIDASGTCAANYFCGGGHSHPTTEITGVNAGTDLTADLEEEGVSCTDCIADDELDGGFGWTLDTDLNFDSNTLVVSQDDDRVGVGTAIPTHTFSVVGTMNVTRAAGSAGGIEVDSSGNVIIRLG